MNPQTPISRPDSRLVARRSLLGSLLKGAALSTVAGDLLFRAASPLLADEKAAGPQANQVTGNEITPQQRAAVDKGLEWLKRAQKPNGCYSENQSSAGITGLAGLAFASQGNLPNRGKYGEQVEKCLQYVLGACQPSGLISSDATHGPMYGHGFATVFLGEMYGMTQDERIREKLENAVRLIERTQNKEGGWRYQPAPIDADISVTICEIMGLRSASDAGIKVEKQVIEDAIKYVKKCQCSDGGFSYVAGMGGGGGSGFARTAAGVAALYYAGWYQTDQGKKDLERGLKYLMRMIPGKGGGDAEGNFYYGNYYAVQAMFLAGGEYWAQWYPAIRDTLIKRQTAGGNWSGDVNDDYATSLALIILQMPNRYLPVFNGKGPGS